LGVVFLGMVGYSAGVSVAGLPSAAATSVRESVGVLTVPGLRTRGDRPADLG
jgi:hypothetical protein